MVPPQHLQGPPQHLRPFSVPRGMQLCAETARAMRTADPHQHVDRQFLICTRATVKSGKVNQARCPPSTFHRGSRHKTKISA